MSAGNGRAGDFVATFDRGVLDMRMLRRRRVHVNGETIVGGEGRGRAPFRVMELGDGVVIRVNDREVHVTAPAWTSVRVNGRRAETRR